MSLVKQWVLRINTSVSMHSSRWRYETKSFHPRNKNEIEGGSLYNLYQLRISDSTSIYLFDMDIHDIHRFCSGMCVFFSVCVWAIHWIFPWELAVLSPSQLRLTGLTFLARKRFPVKIFRKIQIHPNIPVIVSHLHIQLRSQHPICKKKSKSSKKQIQKYNCKNHFSNFFHPARTLVKPQQEPLSTLDSWSISSRSGGTVQS